MVLGNVLSLCDGISGGQMALVRSGIKYEKYYSSEIDKFAITATQHNYPHTIQLGDVTKIDTAILPKIDLLISGSPCFVAGTLILTSSGYKKIEDVVIGDYVITHNNVYRKVTDTFINYTDRIYRLGTMCSEDLMVTGDHPFYVRKRYGGKSIRKFTDPEWVKTIDLNNDYYVGTAINTNSEIPKWNGIVSINGHSVVNKNVIGDYMKTTDFWWLVGRYMRDGYKRKKTNNSSGYWVYICFSGIKENELAVITSKIGNMFKYHTDKNRNVHKISIESEEFYKYLKQFGKYAHGKKLTSDIIDLPTDLLKGFLDGYFSANGYFYEKQSLVKVTTVSKELIYGISQCIMKVYKRPCSIGYNLSKDTGVIDGRMVTRRNNYCLSFKKNNGKQDQAFYENGYVWYPIRKLGVDDYNGKVYNMEVEVDNSYTANNIIVHNCTDFSSSGKQKGMVTKENVILDSLEKYLELKSKGFEFEGQSYLFWEFIRILKETKPKYFLMENVVMKKYWEDIISNTLGVEPLLIDSALVTAQNRKRLYWTNIQGIAIPDDIGIVWDDVRDKTVVWPVLEDHETPTSFGTSHGKKLDHTKEIYGIESPASIVGRRLNHNGHREDYNKDVPITQCLEVRGGNKMACLTTVKKDTVVSILPHGRYPGVYTKLELGKHYRDLTIKECCRLQTVPEEYFFDSDGNNIISNSQIMRALGNGWTIDVITHIFNNMKKISG